MIQLYFSTAAREKLDAVFDYLEQQQLGLGYRFTADVDDVLARIRSGGQLLPTRKIK